MANRKWYNNGEINKQFVPGEEAEGFVLGRIKQHENVEIQSSNETENDAVEIIPEEIVKIKNEIPDNFELNLFW